MNPARIAIPMKLTTHGVGSRYRRHDDPADAEGGPRETVEQVSTGVELTRQMVEYLDYMCFQATAADRLAQLAEVNPDAHRAWTLRQRRWRRERIASEMHYSERTISRLVVQAKAFIGGSPVAPTEDQRIEVLSAMDPRAFTVYVLTSYRWHQPQIADHLQISVDTVQRDLRRATGAIGHPPHGRLRRYRQHQVGV